MRRPWLWPSERAAKAEVYQEFADDFRSLRPVYGSDKKERRAAARRKWMSLALCDPLVRDGLADALQDAEEQWRRLSMDEPRDWEIVRRVT